MKKVKKIDLNPPVVNFGGLDPPAELPATRCIDVHGRVEHEAMLRDSDKMWSLGLDPAYEKMVYLRRWGSWLNGCENFSGKNFDE